MRSISRVFHAGALFGASILLVDSADAGVSLNVTNNSNIPNKQICLQGASQASLMNLNSQGNFVQASTSAYLDSISLPQGTSSLITVPSGVIGARIYAFFVDSSTACPAQLTCWVNSTWVQPPVGPLGAGCTGTPPTKTISTVTYPPFAIIEADTSGSGNYTFDLSQVDAMSAPIKASVSQSETTAAFYEIGQSARSGTYLQSYIEQYKQFMQKLEANSPGTGKPYLSLLQSYNDSTTFSAGSNSFPPKSASIENPYHYLQGTACPAHIESPLHTAFDAQLNQFFKAGNSVKVWFNGGDDAPYTGTAGTTPYPLADGKTTVQLQSMSFQGATPFVIPNPVGSTVYSVPGTGGLPSPILGSTTINQHTITFNQPLPQGAIAPYWWILGPGTQLSPGATSYVTAIQSAADGRITGVTVDNTAQFNSLTDQQYCFTQLKPFTYGNGQEFQSSGEMVLGSSGVFAEGAGDQINIENLIDTAFNRGVATMAVGTGTSCVPTTAKGLQAPNSYCWGQENNFYPLAVGSGLNHYAHFLHVAQKNTRNLFAQNLYKPNSTPYPYTVDSNGLQMGMAYGFSYDETPAAFYQPSAYLPNPPQVPSKWDTTLKNGATVNVVFEPWQYPGLQGVNGAGSLYLSPDLSSWQPMNGSLSQLYAAKNQFELAGVNTTGSIFYAKNLGSQNQYQSISWQQIPGTLKKVVLGDLNGDGNTDIVGINASQQIWYATNLATSPSSPNWTQLSTGTLQDIATGDVNGDGNDDIIGIGSNGRIYYTVNLSSWSSMSGDLSQIAAGDLNGDGRADIAGVNASLGIWYTTDLGINWMNPQGTLQQVDIGILPTSGKVGIAGVNASGQIFATPINPIGWINVPGQLSQVTLGGLTFGSE